VRNDVRFEEAIGLLLSFVWAFLSFPLEKPSIELNSAPLPGSDAGSFGAGGAKRCQLQVYFV
jgi:hypothetical protein